MLIILKYNNEYISLINLYRTELLHIFRINNFKSIISITFSELHIFIISNFIVIKYICHYRYHMDHIRKLH